MSNSAPSWVAPVMRAGYAARGVVYTVVGGLALAAAFYGGQAEGTTNALASLRGVGWGIPLLWAIAVGLFAYTVWRLIDAAYDLEDYGTGAKGVIARTGQVVTGLIHAAIGVSVAGLAMGRSSGGSGASDWSAKVMSMPYGPWIVIGVGLVTMGAGAFYVHKGVTGKYQRALRVTPLTRRLDPAMKAGFIAQGGVVAVIGGLLVLAGFTTDPQEAGGVGEALQQLRSVTYGRILLGAVALGLLGFALENFVEAIYRILPRVAGSDVMTLARAARDKAERAAS